MRRTMLGLAATALSCAGGDPLDTDDPYPAAPGFELDSAAMDGEVSDAPTDSGDEGGGTGPDDTGGAGGDECSTEAPELLTVELVGTADATLTHSGVDLAPCDWRPVATIDAAGRQVAVSYLSDEDPASCGEPCDHAFSFGLTDLASGEWTFLAGSERTTLTVP